MATTACFMIVSRNDIPIYEAEVGTAPKKEDAAHQHQFILHAALDIVQDLAWTTSAMFLKSIDRFNDLVVSVYVTAGHTRLMLLHDSRNDDGIKSFFQEVHELYIKDLASHHLTLIPKLEPLPGSTYEDLHYGPVLNKNYMKSKGHSSQYSFAIDDWLCVWNDHISQCKRFKFTSGPSFHQADVSLYYLYNC
uniref:Transport protein particle 20 kDa subunit isoform X1 n=1 Tax=Nicotiana tabacum TaxID=4097 RepID=A0A1S3YTY9_TOBAC|nr:PREDICTED: transport protein particle 20 kDa subunit-like isoform X1 [Nicotiana tabacum]XP_016455685.1 PREDICTED: transport protein particle 20 kDa subunit-like isoform X1 [Nicotiana tabacum]